MKLLDLETNSLAKSQKVFESYFEKKINLSAITHDQAFAMLKKVKEMESRRQRFLETLKERKMLKTVWKSWISVWKGEKM